jgi:uncharacterized YigZ family protein
MLFSDTYRTIETPAQSVFRDRASKFIGIVMPVAGETEVKEKLALLRKEYWDANHHCYAYQLGFDKSAYRMNDDGEPSGTAGRPIFGQIQSKDLTNVLVVVIRYFGGTKLGVSGLINAYKSTAKGALDAAVIVERTVNEVFRVKFSYEHMNSVMKILKDENLIQREHQFEMQCSLVFSVRKNESERICQMFMKINGVQVDYLRTE